MINATSVLNNSASAMALSVGLSLIDDDMLMCAPSAVLSGCVLLQSDKLTPLGISSCLSSAIVYHLPGHGSADLTCPSLSPHWLASNPVCSLVGAIGMRPFINYGVLVENYMLVYVCNCAASTDSTRGILHGLSMIGASADTLAIGAQSTSRHVEAGALRDVVDRLSAGLAEYAQLPVGPPRLGMQLITESGARPITRNLPMLIPEYEPCPDGLAAPRSVWSFRPTPLGSVIAEGDGKFIWSCTTGRVVHLAVGPLDTIRGDIVYHQIFDSLSQLLWEQSFCEGKEEIPVGQLVPVGKLRPIVLKGMMRHAAAKDTGAISIQLVATGEDHRSSLVVSYIRPHMQYIDE